MKTNEGENTLIEYLILINKINLYFLKYTLAAKYDEDGLRDFNTEDEIDQEKTIQEKKTGSKVFNVA